MTKEKFLNKFKSEQKLKFNAGFQNWWTEFIFHYNDLHNIVSILNSGKLYSRNKAKYNKNYIFLYKTTEY